MDEKGFHFNCDDIESKSRVDTADQISNEYSNPFINDTDSEVNIPDPFKTELYDWVQIVVSALLCVILIFVFFGRVVVVDGFSMLQTLQNGDRLIASNLFFTPEYGDIVVIKTEFYGDSPLVKRVIATEGQTIEINFETGEVTVDGLVLEEYYISTPTTDAEDFSGPVTVPEGCVFVMGDNRGDSSDSRSNRVGMVDVRQILGKVYFVIIPGADSEGNRNWSRIGSVY